MLEGLDGCGKSTQIQLLGESLNNKGYEIRVVEEPGGTELGIRVRNLLLNSEALDIRPLSELFLYEASRSQLVESVIKPALENGITVLSDRFSLSSVAYQGYGRGVPLNLVEELNKIAQQDIDPDLTILLDIPVEKLAERKDETGLDRIERESTEFYRRVAKGFRAVAEQRESHLVLDGTLKKEQIHQRISQRVKELLQ